MHAGNQHDWNRLEILAQGNRIRVVCNGTLISDWRDREPHRIKAGPIGLQLHSNDVPQEVYFRLGRVAASETEAPGLLANLVCSG
jgi:hypothetical protein